MTRKTYTRRVRILKEYKGNDFKKKGGKYPPAVFNQFKNRPIFYIIKPPHCVEGYKLGRAEDGATRLRAYQYKYGTGFQIRFVLLLEKRRDKETGVSAEKYFEQLVKDILRPKKLPGRGDEFYKTERIITAAVSKVRKTFEGKMQAQVGTQRESARLKKKIPVPKAGDKVLFMWGFKAKDGGGKKLYRAKIERVVNAKKHIYYLRFYGGHKDEYYLKPKLFRKSPTNAAEWKILA